VGFISGKMPWEIVNEMRLVKIAAVEGNIAQSVREQSELFFSTGRFLDAAKNCIGCRFREHAFETVRKSRDETVRFASRILPSTAAILTRRIHSRISGHFPE